MRGSSYAVAKNLSGTISVYIIYYGICNNKLHFPPAIRALLPGTAGSDSVSSIAFALSLVTVYLWVCSLTHGEGAIAIEIESIKEKMRGGSSPFI